jgi:hypothetical protein
MSDLLLAFSIVDAKGKVCPTNTRLPIIGTNVSARILTELPRVSLKSIKAVITVAWMSGSTTGFFRRNASGTVQANVITAGANFQFVFALNSKKTSGADAMLPQLTVCHIELAEFGSILLYHLVVFDTLTAFSIILALQIACLFRNVVVEFANRAMVTVGANAVFVATKRREKGVEPTGSTKTNDLPKSREVLRALRFIHTLSAVGAKEVPIVVCLLVAKCGRLWLTELSSVRLLFGGRVLAVALKAVITIFVSRLDAFGSIEAMEVSAILSVDLTLGAKFALRTIAVLKLPVVLPPKLVVHGNVVFLDT